ncbi:MAG: tail fiber domain-containing protein [Flavobacteriia bacterium]|nr:tail fiber domain-containing protein [Flavobacteriia bacterium]
MKDNVILGGHLNTIEGDCNQCTIINGANNAIFGANNVHAIGDDIIVYGSNHPNGSIDNDNCFYVGCTNGVHIYGPLEVDGNISAEGDIVAFSSSDKRLKENIQPIKNCLNKVLSLDAIEFEWNNKQSTYSGKDVGLIAQQVNKIAPEIVSKRDDGFYAMKYEKIIPLLVGAIKQQSQEIEKLEEELSGKT